MSSDQSLAEQLRASLTAAQEARELDMVMPRTEPPLHIVFRSLGYAEVRQVTVRSVRDARGLDAAETDKYRAAEVLCAASTGCYVTIDATKHELPAFGLGLYNAIFPADPADATVIRPENDRQAVFGLFGQNDMDLMALLARYEMWSGSISAEAVEDLLGNS